MEWQTYQFDGDFLDRVKNIIKGKWVGYKVKYTDLQYNAWIKANDVTDIEFEMIEYNTQIVKPNSQEIVKYGLQ